MKVEGKLIDRVNPSGAAALIARQTKILLRD